eukprot:scaffold1272_cov250-Pinguiococcus_pyrenoidosus.AAC.46
MRLPSVLLGLVALVIDRASAELRFPISGKVVGQVGLHSVEWQSMRSHHLSRNGRQSVATS